MSLSIKQARIVTDLDAPRPGTVTELIAFFNADGTPADLGGGTSFTAADAQAAIKNKAQVNALAPVTATNAAPAAGAEPTKAEYDVLVTLANANKTALNAIIAALKA